ncbi:MAG: KTSC domain-containing protein [Sphingomonas sp.]|nr:KTSC domain-containing protein [Sphingomonas sp.]
MPSSVIRRFSYDPGSRELLVTFTTGRRYVYSDVPVDEAQQFRSAFAKGVHFNRFIRGRFPCRELEPHEPGEGS